MVEVGVAPEVVVEDVLLLEAVAEDGLISFEVTEGVRVLVLSLGIAEVESAVLSMGPNPVGDVTGVAKIPSNAVAHTTVISEPAFVGITVARAVLS